MWNYICLQSSSWNFLPLEIIERGEWQNFEAIFLKNEVLLKNKSQR